MVDVNRSTGVSYPKARGHLMYACLRLALLASLAWFLFSGFI